MRRCCRPPTLSVDRSYKVAFTKPIEHELVVELDLASLSHRNEEHLELLWLVAKEGWQKAGLGEYHTQKQALSRFSVGALLMTEPVLEVIRRELRRISPGVRIETDEIKNVLLHDVIKREVVEGEKADHAKRQITRAASRALRKAPREGKGAVAPEVIEVAAIAPTTKAAPTAAED